MEPSGIHVRDWAHLQYHNLRWASVDSFGLVEELLEHVPNIATVSKVDRRPHPQYDDAFKPFGRRVLLDISVNGGRLQSAQFSNLWEGTLVDDAKHGQRYRNHQTQLGPQEERAKERSCPNQEIHFAYAEQEQSLVEINEANDSGNDDGAKCAHRHVIKGLRQGNEHHEHNYSRECTSQRCFAASVIAHRRARERPRRRI
mmetsp:Transcript_8233/g.21234  ORF Transcript_8233/g.21234 Transcript_8233/m.21234 type:complete len:200 (-) Transcript_8233:1277-1876(-)